MADTLNSEHRSRIMSRVGGKNTRPEILVRRALHAAGLRFRIHRRDLPGTPDIVLPRHRIAVMVQGCFWHGHDCPKGRRPKSNVEFWTTKLDRNLQRDRANADALSKLGWQVVTVWECALDDGVQAVLARVQASTRAIEAAR